MYQKNYFKIQIENNEEKEETIEFYLTIENDEITDGGSFNPTTGWTGYTQFNDGWREQDPEEQEMIEILQEFLLREAMWIETHVAEMEENEEKTYKMEYEGYHITLTTQSIEYYDDDI